MGFDLNTIDRAVGRGLEALQIVQSADVARAKIKTQGAVDLAAIRAGQARSSITSGSIAGWLPIVGIGLAALVGVKLLTKVLR